MNTVHPDLGSVPRSAPTLAKDRTKQANDGTPMQRRRSPLKDVATICRNSVRIGERADAWFDRVMFPTDVQPRAFELLGVSVDAAT